MNKMQDVTSDLDRYREGSRHLWNSCFRTDDGALPRDDILDRFEKIDRLLFTELVLAPLGKDKYEDQVGSMPLPFLRVVPIAETIPILVARDGKGRNKYWDDPVNRIQKSGCSLTYINCFDWNSYGYVDYRYMRVRIESLSEHADLVGREALVETVHVRVCHLDSQ